MIDVGKEGVGYYSDNVLRGIIFWDDLSWYLKDEKSAAYRTG